MSRDFAEGPGWRLNLGDCIAGMRELADDSVDVTISDPPYSKHTHAKQWVTAALTDRASRRKTTHDSLDFGHITAEQMSGVAEQTVRVTRRWIGVFTDIEGIAGWCNAYAPTGAEYVRSCIWDKVNSSPQFTGDRPAASAEAFVLFHRSGRKAWNGGGRRNVFRFEVKPDPGQPGPHPTTKPLPLMRELVSLFSDPDELILDPFAGSGSTGIACRQLGRRFLGFELSRDYFDIACRRLRGEEAKPNPAQPSLFGAIS